MNIYLLIYKLFQNCKIWIIDFISQRIVIGYFKHKNISFDYKKIHVHGIPYINIGKKTHIIIGKNVTIVSGYSRGIETSFTSKINIKDGACLIIGNNTGMTNIVIQCHKKICIGENVNIGAGTMIFDTDFHSLNWRDRQGPNDLLNKKSKPIFIKDNVFIGCKCIILKGVTIGNRSIVGAGSVVTKDIPDDEIWAGNPARFIRKIE